MPTLPVIVSSFLLEMAKPTYNALLHLLEQAESQSGSHLSIAELLTIKFSESYPHITVSRPSRFLDTVKRITAPIVNGRLQDAEKEKYLEREWTPRIRNPSKGLCQSFPVINYYSTTWVWFCSSYVGDPSSRGGCMPKLLKLR